MVEDPWMEMCSWNGQELLPMSSLCFGAPCDSQLQELLQFKGISRLVWGRCGEFCLAEEHIQGICVQNPASGETPGTPLTLSSPSSKTCDALSTSGCVGN